MKNAPFVFGKTAESENFTNRVDERRRLAQNFGSLVNTTIISPRRWGKSSLVKRVAQDVIAKDKKARVCIIDLFSVRNEAEFYAKLATAVVKSTSNRWQEWLALAKEMFSHLRPQITFTSDMREEISFDVEWDKVCKSPDEILDLPELIANSKKLSIIVCIDEFQNISNFADPLAFQRKLRSHWQSHQHVCYCLYGSKRHMLADIFSNPSMPFYRFGDIMLLGKIANEDWAEFIVKRFNDTGKSISRDAAGYLARLVNNHSYYVQQLALQAWLRTDDKCSLEIIDAALRNLKDQLGLLFSNLSDTLTARQLGFLQALLNGETLLSSTDVLRRYQLGTSANAIRIRDALQEREIIDVSGSSIEILDPLFAYWLAQDYFK